MSDRRGRIDFISRFFFTDLSAVPAFALAGAIGLAYAIILLGPGPAFGMGRFWEWPSAITPGATLDIRLSLSGYYWLAQDSWHWPLLEIAKADWPRGTNAGLMDTIPVASLLAKLLHSLTGTVVDFFPLWVSGTYALNAAALNSLVRSLGQRTLLATVVSAALGALAPVIHHRFGHPSLSPHWIFVFALAIYVAAHSETSWTARRCAGLVALTLLATCVNLYLLVMTGAIAVAAFLQGAWDRQMGISKALGLCALTLAAGVLPQWTFGLFGAAGLGSTTLEFGQDSMNLLSPFWPQTSGAFGWTHIYWLTRGSIGATTGQYEGYAYFGLGALMLIILALFRARGGLWTALRRNWIITGMMVVLTLWALSNRIYIGPVLVASFPVPDFLLHTLLAWFRSSGRFFWPVGWLIVGWGIAGALAGLRPRVAVSVALLALALQWIDLASWRAQIAAVVDAPVRSALGSEDVVRDLSNSIAASGTVTVVPRIFCSSFGAMYRAVPNVAANDVQLLASRVNARMTSAFLARGAPPCDEEKKASLAALMGDGMLVVLADPGGKDRVAEARSLLSCRDLAVGVACVGQAGAHAAAAGRP